MHVQKRNYLFWDHSLKLWHCDTNFAVWLMVIIRYRIEGGGWPRVWSLNKRDFWNKWSLNKFRKIAYIEWFFDLFRHFKHYYAIKASTFTKLNDFSLKYQNLSKFSAPAAPKSGQWTQSFPKIFKSSFKFLFFLGAFGADNAVFRFHVFKKKWLMTMQ